MFGYGKRIAELEAENAALKERLAKVEEAVAKRFVSDNFREEEETDAKLILREYLLGEEASKEKEGSNA